MSTYAEVLELVQSNLQEYYRNKEMVCLVGNERVSGPFRNLWCKMHIPICTFAASENDNY